MSQEELFRLIRSGRTGREKAARHLYGDLRLRNSVRKAISFGVVNDSDFWDIYHTMIVQFFKYVVKNPEFTLSRPYYAYLSKSARNLWYMRLRKKNRLPESLPEGFDIPERDTKSALEVLENQEHRNLIRKVLALLGTKCKEVLLLWAQGKKMDEIRIDLGFSTVEAVRKRKYDCLKKISKYLDENPQIKELLL